VSSSGSAEAAQRTISPSLSLYKMVVLPAASSPTIKIRISFLEKRLLNKLWKDPILKSRGVQVAFSLAALRGVGGALLRRDCGCRGTGWDGLKEVGTEPKPERASPRGGSDAAAAKRMLARQHHACQHHAMLLQGPRSSSLEALLESTCTASSKKPQEQPNGGGGSLQKIEPKIGSKKMD